MAGGQGSLPRVQAIYLCLSHLSEVYVDLIWLMYSCYYHLRNQQIICNIYLVFCKNGVDSYHNISSKKVKKEHNIMYLYISLISVMS